VRELFQGLAGLVLPQFVHEQVQSFPGSH
jgi:hypothetical protein